MFMKDTTSGDLVRVNNVNQLASPHETHVDGCRQAGEEEQDERQFSKGELEFPSGEPLPKCWTDAHYQVA
ncbi:acetyltransferase [Aureliella helgolandensis]|uniref:Acetyltransferase n=1 Tax=Aureliella helgolandensis TaxID=2527968 RepID=A0A518GB65_9BACT|nr:acetyltransferase [Aureliella helgolandensis]QDV25842.1 hypothetical protein Q31a_41700 [Aureliella helgolandensis]